MTPFLQVTLLIVRMDDVHANLFQLQTGIVHDAPVDIIKRTVSFRARDEGRDRLYDQSEVLFTLAIALGVAVSSTLYPAAYAAALDPVAALRFEG